MGRSEVRAAGGRVKAADEAGVEAEAEAEAARGGASAGVGLVPLCLMDAHTSAESVGQGRDCAWGTVPEGNSRVKRGI